MNKGATNIVESILGPFIVRNSVTDIDRFMSLLSKIIAEANSFDGFKSLKSKAQNDKLLQDALPALDVLEEAFTSLTPRKAMDLFEKRRYLLLRVNRDTWNLWLNQHTPFYTYQDLLHLIQRFERYANRHQKSLLANGYPTASFEASLWLYFKLARLYPIKIPASIKKEQSRGGNRTEAGDLLRSSEKDCFLTYSWSKEIRYWEDESQINRPCSYEEAPILPRLIHKDIEGIERMRSIVLDLKMRILKIASESLASKCSNRGDHLAFWDQCMDAIFEMLPQEDFQLLSTIDEQYSDVAWGCGFEDEETGYVFSNPITGRSNDMPVGGIKNILEFIFFIEREFTIGRMHNTKTKLLSMVGNGASRSYWQLITNKKISSRIDKLMSEFWEYHQHEDRLNQELNERLATDLSKKLRVPLHVKAEYYDMLESAAQFIEKAKNVHIDVVMNFMKTASQRPGIMPIRLPPGVGWNGLTIEFLDDCRVKIVARGFSQVASYSELIGFQNQRTKKPNDQWEFLKLLAKNNGELSWDYQNATISGKKKKQLLAEALRNVFQLNEDPFYSYRIIKAYKVKFTLLPPNRPR